MDAIIAPMCGAYETADAYEAPMPQGHGTDPGTGPTYTQLAQRRGFLPFGFLVPQVT